jgi:hypothetical protein
MTKRVSWALPTDLIRKVKIYAALHNLTSTQAAAQLLNNATQSINTNG